MQTLASRYRASAGLTGSDLLALIFCGGPQLGNFEFLIDDLRFE